ncbi:alpha/beta fold hydrolase [Paraburkholderia sp. BL21I4N1]|uniref:alpha/beta fold hydrolase n=1 Tax=Paraburkholderia sp. BL21I4N1 TaxID=1938801 RepID=UPI000D4B3095|nr:alpha/beta fold hydrolase [Paraburkholderia sp. BL21I4N1]PQV50710.1 poly(3-hydroxyalkanoate) synthetase [Paraburkholderia sp. BL21I4N1]
MREPLPNPTYAFALPFFWPMAAAAAMLKTTADLSARNLAFLAEEEKIHFELRPALASQNQPLLDLRTMVFRDYSTPHARGMPTIVDAPYAGHSAMIADYQPGQSLMETLRDHGLSRLYLTDWKSATDDMKDLEIDQYLAELNVCVDEVGGCVNLVGLCQGGWMAAMYAARFPHKVASLVLAGSPIDTDAGDGPVRRMAQTYPTSFYQELVDMGRGVMRGKLMLRGWKNMHPEQHYMTDHIDLYEHMDDPAYLRKEEIFESWYENPIDLPGRWYLQAIVQLFKENRFAKGTFVALGQTLNLRAVTCPVYLLAGEADDITTKEQVFDAVKYLGTAPGKIVRKLVPGGHIGLFMGSRTLKDAWPEIAAWVRASGERLMDANGADHDHHGS